MTIKALSARLYATHKIKTRLPLPGKRVVATVVLFVLLASSLERTKNIASLVIRPKNNRV